VFGEEHLFRMTYGDVASGGLDHGATLRPNVRAMVKP
jgi:hypothetical protein